MASNKVFFVLLSGKLVSSKTPKAKKMTTTLAFIVLILSGGENLVHTYYEYLVVELPRQLLHTYKLEEICLQLGKYAYELL